ncbi:MAG: alpha/beta hydrolase fold domain-containing protein [Ignavibacteria bacterium]|nr:alpha/beta hydrolase fold domain-containing protein [Ignavibacteria bacterium]MCU7504458.1 alpha/beta hydrolase fold domain-containing protein [Ignavibacteria bacterium]MCU7517451.1 alpha/beta hydrolase fold domain-containing protein [Ignavibacteria bacterium]
MKPTPGFLFYTICLCIVSFSFGSTIKAQKPDFANVEYAKVNGKSLKLDIYLPKSSKGKIPLVVWIHGGGWKYGNKSSAFTAAALLLSKGYAVAGINYRLSQDSVFPAQLNDCKAAIRFLRANAHRYNFDPEKIGVWGSSAGGHLASLLGTTGGIMTSVSGNIMMNMEGNVGSFFEVSSRVQAVCDFYGPTDFLRMDGYHLSPRSNESLLVGGALKKNPDRCMLANPVRYVSPDDPPFFIAHGTKDPVVPFNQSELLNKALRQAFSGNRKEVVFYPVKDAIHGGNAFNSDALLKRVLAFFERNLKSPSFETEQTEKVLDRFYLHQNYPNPFNPFTVINYSLSSPGFVNLQVFDCRGREVASLVNRFEMPGSYSISFNPSKSVKSGIYYYRLSDGKNIMTRKMLLLK